MLKIYGVPNSQPVRAVVWLCAIQQLPFEFVMTSQNRAAKTPEYLSNVNPRGTIPAIDDGSAVLWESHAIMIYLCEKHGWADMWPNDLALRTKVNQYLHFHHRNTREIVVPWSRALWASVFEVPNPDSGWYARNTFPGLGNNEEVVTNTLRIIDGMLSEADFIAGEYPTLADISAYEELGQNQAKFANCIDFGPYRNIQRWFVRMEQLPQHDSVHEIWRLIGDVNRVEGGMASIAKANKSAAKTYANLGAV